MFRVGSWLYNRKPGANASTQSLDSLSESHDLEHALRAATLILNDDVDGAEAGLSKGNSTFHKLGKGVVGFMRATLGFEQEIMREASDRLIDAESSASSDQHKAQHHANAPNTFHSRIYDPGTEFALCQAMAQIMGAVVGVLNESLTESIKGFYKMRKAFITLDGILKMEERYLQTGPSGKSPSHTSPMTPVEAGTPSEKSNPSSPAGSIKSQSRETHELPQAFSQLKITEDNLAPPSSSDTSTLILTEALGSGPESEVFSSSIDAFIHSGANLCFGMLLLIISMIPPTFSRLLAIIGFRGDKERGLRMLWQASKFHSLIGAIASLGLLGYYNGFVRYCDIIPDATTEDEADVEGYPMERLAALLTKMRSRYPRSQLWLLEESRMMGANRNLQAALELLMSGSKSPLKQVEALRTFEKSMNAMYLHKYELCAQSFLECVELNSWSPSLYYYIAGSCHLVLYRHKSESDPTAAAEHAKKATEFFLKAPTLAGKKRLMSRQLPFDIFVSRKIAKWEARSKQWKVDLVDAVGVDPIEEMIFFWNGHSRMGREELEDSLQNLAWSESSANKTWDKESEDEKAILSVLRAAVLRALRRHREAKEILQTQVLNLDRSLFKGHLKDDWICPVAHFEMAANLWMERPTYLATHGPADSTLKPTISRSSTATPSEREVERVEREKVRKCEEHLDKVAKWESFELDTRIGLKVTAAREAVRKWNAAHPDTTTDVAVAA
ncbi:hypothetical protein VTN77DRAFT_4423 [Rasamsonia byssochlamydoides]|uniref:uncharacterized protein n=1 Tax=Rasamsonia byssochlamydoides TaxID=89139 RepID=UPI003742AC54